MTGTSTRVVVVRIGGVAVPSARSDDDSVLVFSKRHEGDVVIVVINLDPHGTRETMVHLDMPALGMGWHGSFVAHDEITGEDWSWSQHNYVRLDPGHEPAHVISVRRTR